MSRKQKKEPFLAPLRLRVPSVFSKIHLIGAPPGELAIHDDQVTPKIVVHQYSKDSAIVHDVEHPSELAEFLAHDGVSWVDVQGLGSEEVLRSLAHECNIPPLALEDMVNVPQRPKIVAYDDAMLWVTRMVRIDDAGFIDREQVSFFHRGNLLVSIQQRPGDIFDPVRKRIREGKGRIRSGRADYLAYALVDTVVDGYYPIVQRIGLALEAIESQVMVNATPEHLAAINQTRLLATTLRRGISAQREALSLFLASPTSHVETSSLPYLSDTLDHATQIYEVMDNQKDQVSGLLNTYLSMVSYRSNEVMKVLTIMASIFIPLTFVAGIYGMNFENMPELSKPWAYPAALGAMATMAMLMVLYFVRKGWIGFRQDKKLATLTRGEQESDE